MMSFEEITPLLGDFADRIDHVWEAYEAVGPGQVDTALFDPIEQAARKLDALRTCALPADVDRAVLRSAVDRATDLARRCVTLPQGLSFVSGEAGLVPRRDQIDAFAAARANVRDAFERLKVAHASD